jgi:hypothetical protein
MYVCMYACVYEYEYLGELVICNVCMHMSICMCVCILGPMSDFLTMIQCVPKRKDSQQDWATHLLAQPVRTDSRCLRGCVAALVSGVVQPPSASPAVCTLLLIPCHNFTHIHTQYQLVCVAYELPSVTATSVLQEFPATISQAHTVTTQTHTSIVWCVLLMSSLRLLLPQPLMNSMSQSW